VRAGTQHASSLAGEQLRGAVAVDDGQHGALPGPAARR
jgi:hypothetical protein